MTHKIVIFAGTTEGRRLSELLAAAGIGHTVCVATEYGEIVLNRHPSVHIHRGRMDQAEILSFLKEGQFSVAIDATHPFAGEITRNIRAAVEQLSLEEIAVSYLRLKRNEMARREGVTYFASNEACAEALEHIEGNILLTTGSKELSCYCKSESIRDRLYVRILPRVESLPSAWSGASGESRLSRCRGPLP